MSKPSHIPIFPDSYHRDTTHLTTEEHGAYFLLLMAAWGSNDCSLPNDEKRLAALVKMSPTRWRKIAPTVLEFWDISNGRISQSRLKKEWNYVHEVRAKRAAAGRVGGLTGCKANAKQMDKQNESKSEAPIGGGGGEGELPNQVVKLVPLTREAQ